MGGGQKRTIICGCGKHIKGSVREVLSRAKVHKKICDLLDDTDLDRPFDYRMNGMNGVNLTRRGFIQQRPLIGVATEQGHELFRDEIKVMELFRGLQQ